MFCFIYHKTYKTISEKKTNKTQTKEKGNVQIQLNKKLRSSETLEAYMNSKQKELLKSFIGSMNLPKDLALELSEADYDYELYQEKMLEKQDAFIDFLARKLNKTRIELEAEFKR